MESLQSSQLTPPHKEARQSANFHPSVWTDFFISRPPLPDIEMASLKSKNDELKVEVRKMLIDATDPLHSLDLIDRIQCLGVAYHFEKEIEEKLLKLYETSVGYDDLYTISLYFRLLRQQRYHISCDVFSKFLDEKGEFMTCLSNDVKALLSLYEAAHLYMPGEDILDKALKFSKIQLKALASNIDPYLSEMASLKSRNDELKVEIRKMLIDTTNPLLSLELIDRMQCLGVAYHFKKEIEEKLLKIYETNVGFDDLYKVALHFRLLRQQRYHISCDVFSKFLDEKGEFVSSINNDVKALLSLYEATHLSMPGEEILDKALKFTKIQLKTLASNMDPYLLEMVSSSLEIPLVRRVDRLKAKLYFSIFEKVSICNETLLNFAKLDFNLLQATHQEEARSLSIWWKGLNLAKSLPFTRDRLIEGYFWVLSVYFEPHYSRARLMMTMVISLLSILDDIYDVYGTVEELQLLTDVIESWQLENIGKLPQYMQHEFLALYSNFKEFENKLEQEQYSFRVDYLKEEKKKMAKAFIQEAIWADDGYVPKLNDYLGVSLISSGYGYLACASYIGMQNEIPKDFFDWVTSMPQIIKSANFIARVLNDIATNEFEQKRKHVASAVQCYAMEYGCSNEEACKKLMEMVEEEWKILNREFMFSKKNFPIHLLQTIINLTNVLELAYKDSKDSYTESTKTMKDNIIDVLVEPVKIHMDVIVTCPSSV